MGTDTDIETSSPDKQPLADFDPNKEPAPELDQREPQKTVTETDDGQTGNEPEPPDDEDTGQPEIPLDEMDEQAEVNDQDDETETHLDQSDEEPDNQFAPDDLQELDSEETQAVVEPTPDDSDSDEGNGSEVDATAADAEAPSAQAAQEPEPEQGEMSLEASGSDSDNDEADGSEVESTSPDAEEPSGDDLPEPPSEDGNENDFAALDDDEMDERDDVESRMEEKADDGNQKQENAGKTPVDKKFAKTANKTEALPESAGETPKAKKPAKDATASKKMVASAFIILMVAGAVVYGKPALIGLKDASERVETTKAKMEAPARQPAIQAPQPQTPVPNDRYRSKLAEASRLREELLAKGEEIYRLKLHYRYGIDQLKDQIYREIQAANISSYEEALQNKRIELNLRTIQRRQVYIQELEKPDQWAHKGSEELLFLKRKTLIDLEMKDVAGGVDLDRHMRYINAAIQKYQPSADKLAVDPPPGEQTPLETIWSQLRDQQSAYMQIPVGEQNEKIIAEICSGDFTRIAQLTAITSQAAKCLARMDGSELFLNGLTQLTAKEAENLFKWSGNWICLNGVKKLSPAVAKYLFNWKGNWISLNGLRELPPELALYLTEWKGRQLELMGLDHEKSKPDERALKYLALWETMGGKLFISDDVRNEMKRVM